MHLRLLPATGAVLAVLLTGCSASHATTAGTPAEPAPSASDTTDSDFLFVVGDDLDAQGMGVAGLRDPDIVRFAHNVCDELESGTSVKKAAKLIDGAPWLVEGTAVDFVEAANLYYCPDA